MFYFEIDGFNFRSIPFFLQNITFQYRIRILLPDPKWTNGVRA